MNHVKDREWEEKGEEVRKDKRDAHHIPEIQLAQQRCRRWS